MTLDPVSIERVLNSRCSSDFGPRKTHFGTFKDEHPPDEAIAYVLHCCDIPRFSNGRLLHWFKNEYLFIGFEDTKDPNTQRLLNIESGMQQEAVYLGCAAKGVGTCIHNQGINGTQNGKDTATSRHLIMEIANPYETGKLTTRSPGPQKPFIPGKNLREPSRDGNIGSFEQLLSELTTFSKSGPPANEKDISQLLWAARGRTPHCIITHRWNLMWGLTIPTWDGGQDYTTVYLATGDTLYTYVNWTKEFSLMNRLFREKIRWTRGNPTHDLRFTKNVDISSQIHGHEKVILLCQNENTGRALWEVGYMLENMLLQAKSLGMSYESKIFSEDEMSSLAKMGVANAVAAFFI